jgi:hypothetical protein
MEYKFKFNDKEYTLSQGNCDGLFNDENNEVKGISLDLILEALNDGKEEVDFSKQYYASKCSCEEQEPLNKSYAYLEYHFYIFTKNKQYVINNLSPEYETTSFNKLNNLGKVDNSYIASIIVCPNCGTYTIEIEECLV